jgi:hypothetical protein
MDTHIVWLISVVVGVIGAIATVWLTVVVFHRRRNFGQSPKSGEIVEREQLLRNGAPDQRTRSAR